MMEIDPRTFRKAMGCFATGVTVATVRAADGRLGGLTISSFTSVSLDPPLVLFCLDKKASDLEAFRAGSHFAIHVLRAEQRELSIHFASSKADKWAGIAQTPGIDGTPILSHCLAVYQCKTERIHDEGDHIVLIGRIVKLDYDTGGQPLVYYRGNYAEIT